MKQKRSEGRKRCLPISKAGTSVLGFMMTAMVICSVCVLSFGEKSGELQKENAAAASANAETGSDETVDTVEWRKAGVDEYELTEVKKEASEKTTKTAKQNITLVSDETTELRAEKSTDSDVLAVIGSGEFLKASAKSGSWYKVSYAGQDGYVQAKCFTVYDKGESKAQKAEKIEVEEHKLEADREHQTIEHEKTEGGSGVSYTEAEFDMLSVVVEHEVGYCSDESKLAVANVILNRVKSQDFPDTIEGVLTAPDQFTAVSVYYNGTLQASDSTRECVQRALDGEDNTNGAVYYYAPQYCSGSTAQWFETLTLCLEVDGQRYFK